MIGYVYKLCKTTIKYIGTIFNILIFYNFYLIYLLIMFISKICCQQNYNCKIFTKNYCIPIYCNIYKIYKRNELL